MVRIAKVGEGSIAEALELRIGSRILTVNGARVRDGIDFAFLTAEEELELEVVDPDGAAFVCEISRDPSESLGIVPAGDKIRECANECVFCFIDGNPPGARDPLWLRDDDFRLSFTYGSYVTLTNLGPCGLQRLVDQRLSPLYVSVHATNPELRNPPPQERSGGSDHGPAATPPGGWAAGARPGGSLSGVERRRRTRPHDPGAVRAGGRGPLSFRSPGGAHPLQPEPARAPVARGRGGGGGEADGVDSRAGMRGAGEALVLRRRRTVPDRRAGDARGGLLRRLAASGERGGGVEEPARRVRTREGPTRAGRGGRAGAARYGHLDAAPAFGSGSRDLAADGLHRRGHRGSRTGTLGRR